MGANDVTNSARVDDAAERAQQPRALTRDAILANRAEKRAPTAVNVPQWGGIVYIRVMSGTERDAYEAEIVGNKLGKDRRANLQNLRAKLVARCLVDESGAPMFNWRDPGDIGAIGALDAGGLDIVFQECQRVNGLTDKDVDDLTGN